MLFYFIFRAKLSSCFQDNKIFQKNCMNQFLLNRNGSIFNVKFQKNLTINFHFLSLDLFFIGMKSRHSITWSFLLLTWHHERLFSMESMLNTFSKIFVLFFNFSVCLTKEELNETGDLKQIVSRLDSCNSFHCFLLEDEFAKRIRHELNSFTFVHLEYNMFCLFFFVSKVLPDFDGDKKNH